jgi:hypothetical protein
MITPTFKRSEFPSLNTRTLPSYVECYRRRTNNSPIAEPLMINTSTAATGTSTEMPPVWGSTPSLGIVSRITLSLAEVVSPELVAAPVVVVPVVVPVAVSVVLVLPVVVPVVVPVAVPVVLVMSVAPVVVPVVALVVVPVVPVLPAVVPVVVPVAVPVVLVMPVVPVVVLVVALVVLVVFAVPVVAPVVALVVVPAVPGVLVGDPEGAPWQVALPASATIPSGAVTNCQS